MGRVHSIESMGLMDGPGIRTVFFFQGCPLRCSYCHNPDTQCRFGGMEKSADELVRFAQKMKPYYQSSGGGVTFSGGEPVLQGAFLVECLSAMKKNHIHTAVDTSGYYNETYMDEITASADLFILDIKHYDPKGFKQLTGASIEMLKRTIAHLQQSKTRCWIRHVMVPGITDTEESMEKIFDLIRPLVDQIEKIEVIPYRKSGIEKRLALGMTDDLRDTPEMDANKAKEFEGMLCDMLKCEKRPMKKVG